MSWLEAAELVALGTAAGFINTFAGGGSMLVVPFLIFLGLPANIANATNRIAILLQNTVSTLTFRNQQIIDLHTDYKLLIPTTLGSMAGAWAAVDIHTAVLEKVIAALLVVMFLLLLLEPDRWVKANAQKAKARHPVLRFILFTAIGFYGGFIQIGVGFFLLGGLVLGSGFDLLKANALKVFLVLFYNLVALVIFMSHGLVNWRVGLILSCGNMLGAWTGARLSIRWGAVYIRYILLIALAVVALKLFRFF